MADQNVALDSQPADVALAAGTMLCDGQFTITQQIGAGGFGITYKAEDTVLGRTIVVKECFPEEFCYRSGTNVAPRNQATAEQFRSIVSMFMREARSLAKMRHPHIVGVHRAFEENNTAYMVLDLIEGENLLDVMEMNPNAFSPEVVEALLMDLLDAVEKVHDMDLLHRDISPDNVMIDTAGTAVLIDFGAARGDASRKTRAISSLLVVKDGYSPQEFYVAGSIQTPSSDLYALGATFYHLLTGEAPPNSQARMVEIAGQKPDPCIPLVDRVKGYTPAFLSAIDSAMEILPKERLQSVAEWRKMMSQKTVPAKIKRTPQPETRVITTPSQGLKPELSKSLSALVEETNVVVSKTHTPEAEKPKEVAPPKPVSRVPEWVEEFNRETAGEVPVVDDAAKDVVADTSPRPVDAIDATTVQAKRAKSRVVSARPTSEGRSAGWALDTIAAREKSRGIPAMAADEAFPAPQTTAPTPRQIITPADIAAEEATLQAGVVYDGNPNIVRAVMRMALMGAFFGALVYIGTTAVIASGS